MEVRPGYQQTAVGVIPIDWRAVAAADFVDPSAPICYGVVQVGRNVDSGVPIVAIKFVKEINRAPLHRTSIELERPYARSRVKSGDVLISIKGTIGRVGLVPGGFVGNISRELARLRPRQDYCGEYIAHQLESVSTQARIARAVVGTTRQEFSIATLRLFEIPVPATLVEQRAVATALSDVDELLTGLDRLIAKKRDLKQAAMQRLLTGKTRLPGFQGEWKRLPLGTVVADLEAGVSVNSVMGGDHFSLGEPGILKTSCVANGVFDPEEFKLIDQREISRARLSPRQNTLIISRMNTPNLVGEVGFVEQDYPNLFLPDRLWMTRFRPDSGLWPKWLAYQMSSPITQVAIKDLASGTSGSMKNISKSKLLALPLDFPPPAEQAAIASFLSDMDAELAAIEARRDKICALKQGMMQELLTGRTRLV